MRGHLQSVVLLGLEGVRVPVPPEDQLRRRGLPPVRQDLHRNVGEDDLRGSLALSAEDHDLR